MKYNEIIEQIASNLSESFSEVYHSVEIVTIFDDGKISEKFPAINLGKEWLSLSPADVKDTIYIRRNGDDTLQEELRLGSCTKSYKMRTPLRIVYFNMNGDDKALFFMMQAILSRYVRPVAVIRDKFKLLREESNGAYNFSAKTVYVAIDVFASWDLLADNCDQDFCIELDNPIKKCEPIVESGS